MTADFDAKPVDLAQENDFRLGAILVRPSTRQVEVAGASQTLQPRIMQVLVVMARQSGHVVSRDELTQTCWEGRAVGDDAINRCIQQIRKLGETSNAFEIETIPRVGYRLKAAEAGPDGVVFAAPTEPRPAFVPLASGRRWMAAAVAGLVLAGGLGAWWLNLNSRTVSITPPQERVAFFGFAAADADPRSAGIASETTDTTFAELSRMHVEVAAKADTLKVSAADRLTKATALGAAYALSGEVRIDGEEARFTIRLEDAVTHATLWEDKETSPVGRPLFSPPKQAAFRAAGNTACVVGQRAELSHETSETLQAIADYCDRPYSPLSSADSERHSLALRSLAKLEPRSVFFQTSFAGTLVFNASYLPPDLQAERLGEADALTKEALRLAPGDPFSVAVAEFARNVRGGSPLESEQLLATARPGGSAWGEGFLLYRRGLNLLSDGRTAEAVARLNAAEAQQPSFVQVAAFSAYGLASQGKAADAELLFERIFASEPGSTLVWPTWVRAAVLDGVGDPDAVIAAAPDNAPRASIACWRSVLAAKRGAKPGPSADGLRDCGSTPYILAALGRVNEAFDLYPSSPRKRSEMRMLFAPSARALRADARFLPLVKELGLWEYWIGTRSHPDVCDLPPEKDFEVCAALRGAQAAPAATTRQ